MEGYVPRSPELQEWDACVPPALSQHYYFLHAMKPGTHPETLMVGRTASPG